MAKYIDRYYLNGELYGIKFAEPGGGGRQPGADTVAYYPLIDDTNDHSTNGYDITSLNNTQLTTFNGVKCLDLNNSCAVVSSINSLTTESNWTINCWVYTNSTTGVALGYKEQLSWGGTAIYTYESGYLYLRRGNTSNTDSHITPPAIGQRVNIVLTALNGEGSVYVNNTKTILKTGVVAPSSNGSEFYLGAIQSSSNIRGDGYLSNVIIEKKGWTDTEVQNYFDQTKSLYGIS